MLVTLTVFFEDPFWVGYCQRSDGQTLSVAKVVFGAEPSDWQVLAWLQTGYYALCFSPPVVGVREVRCADNPKRRQRQAAKAQDCGIGTKAQQALQLARDATKLQRASHTKAQREAQQQRMLALHIAKKKAKHRGH